MSHVRAVLFGVKISVFLALVFIGATSQAQNNLFKGKYSVSLSTTETSNSIPLAGAGTTSVVCRSMTGCALLVDQPTGVEDPAIRFLLGAPEMVHLDVEIHGVLDCMDPNPQTTSGDLALMAPRSTVFLNFMPPLDPGTQLSLRWAVNYPLCPISQCINHVIGPDPMAEPNFCARVPTQL
jgi:hypothetical protein